jgi:hypothetical protein
MSATRRRIRRGLGLAVIAAAAACAVLAWSSETPGGGGSTAEGREATIAARRRDVATREASPHPPAMPPLRDRIAAMVDERGIPDDARASLSALGADILALRERETSAIGDAERRAEIAGERRAVSLRSRQVLEALPPGYRAAMRHHRVSARQLAEWVTDRP